MHAHRPFLVVRADSRAASPYSGPMPQEPGQPLVPEPGAEPLLPSPDPPAYPKDLEGSVELADGRQIAIRPIRPGDTEGLRTALATADYETLHARFLGSPPHDEASIRRLVEVDYESRLALVAFAPDGTGVAVARYEGQPGSTSAEIAVAVRPDYRRVGLGTVLVRRLGQAALARGITRFTAFTQAENRSALGVLRASGLTFTLEISQATADIVMMLDEPAEPVTEPVTERPDA